jgi:hypothetical protein
MSSFTVGITAASFTLNQDNFSERRDTLLRTWNFEAFLALATDYTTLASLMSAPVHLGVCPGTAGVTYYLDIGGGAGQGTLVLDNVVGSPFTAVLVGMDRPSAYPGGGRRCRVTFQEAPP